MNTTTESEKNATATEAAAAKSQAHPRQESQAREEGGAYREASQHDVFGENDPARRRAAVDEIFTEDCVFYDPSKGVLPAARRRAAVDEIFTEDCVFYDPSKGVYRASEVCVPRKTATDCIPAGNDVCSAQNRAAHCGEPKYEARRG